MAEEVPAAAAGDAPAQRPWWREMHSCHWWVLLVATLGWLYDGMDQRFFVLARTPALRDLVPGATDAISPNTLATRR